MAVAITFRDVWTDGRRIQAVGTIVFSGNYPAGGEAIDMKAVVGGIDHKRWLSRADPMWLIAQGKAGFVYLWDRVNNKLMVFTNSAGGANAALTEHTAAAYAAGVSGDTVDFYAVGRQLTN